MVKKKGSISAEIGTKPEIVKFILNNKGPVEEAEMRKKLHVDQGNVNRHLHELSEEFNFIELTQTIKKGRRKYNLWDITKIENLKNINGKFSEIKLNKYEKSINIVIRNFGYDINSPEYLYCFVQLFMSLSFFNACLNTDVKLLISKALKLYRYGSGFEDEARIKELVQECNATYIKGIFNSEVPYERFRKTMEEVAQPQQMKEMYIDYVWRTLGMPKKQLRNKHGDSFIEDNIERVMEIAEDLYYDPSSSVMPKEWTESFFEKLKEKVPELSNIEIRTVLITPDEYKKMYLKIKGILSLMEKQQKTFDDTYFNLLFESFLPQDILNGSDLPEELDFAEKIKKYTKEYKDSIKKKNYRIVKGAVDRLIFNEHKVISEIMAQYKMPSILSNIPDDPEKVLHELLKLHGYQHILEYKKSDSAE